MTVDVADGRVTAVYIVRNPAKLRALDASHDGPQLPGSVNSV